MFELSAEGTIFGDKGRLISEEEYENLILDKDKHLFKKLEKTDRKWVTWSSPIFDSSDTLITTVSTDVITASTDNIL